MKIYLRALGSSIFLIASLFFLPAAQAAPGDLDLTFSGDGKLFDFLRLSSGNDIVYATALQPDGKIVAAGKYFSASCAVSRYGLDGSLDPTFDGDGIAHIISGRTINCRAIGVQADGKIVVAGGTRLLNGNLDFAVIRFNSNGSLDGTFGAGGMVITQLATGDDEAYGLVIQPDGKIVAAGRAFATSRRVALARYLADGTLDTTFDSDGKVLAPSQFDAEASAVTIQTDGKIVTAGRNATIALDTLGFMRFNTNGSLDLTFSGDGVVNNSVGVNPSANDVAIQADGKIVAVGRELNSTPIPSEQHDEFLIVRLTTDGTYDTTFDGDGLVRPTLSLQNDRAYGVAIQSDGKIVAAGSSEDVNDSPDTALVRLNTDGTPDASFGANGIRIAPLSSSANLANDVLIQPDGKIVTGGYSTYTSPTREDFTVARFNTDGTMDNSFFGGGLHHHDVGFDSPTGRAVAIQPNGKILVAGGDSNFALFRYNADGTSDNSFDLDGKLETPILAGSDQARSVAIQSDGKIIIAGIAGEITGPPYQSTAAVVRYNADGSPDATFDGDGIFTITPGLWASFRSVVIQPDGKIVLGGQRANPVGGGELLLVRLLPNGTPDNSFDGDGILTIPWDTLPDGAARSVVIQPDGKIVAAGKHYNQVDNDFVVARFTANGVLDSSFDGDGIATTNILGGEEGNSVALQADGKIVVAGISLNFTGGLNERFAVVRYNTDGSLDSTFDGDGKVTTTILGGIDTANAVSIQANGKILVAGSSSPSTATNYQDNEFSMVRYLSDGTPDAAFSGDGKLTIDLWGNTNDFIYGMALDPTGRAVVVGRAGPGLAVARIVGDFVPTARAPFDFDGDGKTDVGIYRPSVGEWWYQRSSDGQVPAFGFGASTDVIVPADYTGDGKTDVAFFRPSTGQWFVLRSEDNSFFSFPFGTNGDMPVPADFDADGKADVAVFRPSDGHWYIRRSSDGVTTDQAFGTNGDRPVAADYDGDGRADIAIYRPSVGEWWLNRTTAGVIAYAFGNSTDQAVPADYTGDGKADVAFWRPVTGEWFILRSEDASYYSGAFGASTDVVAPGDYDGDGKTDVTVFRPSNGTWYSQRSSSGTVTQQFGAAGDRPIPNAFVR
jgi:uncharacterized delta-60 repeat protein